MNIYNAYNFPFTKYNYDNVINGKILLSKFGNHLTKFMKKRDYFYLQQYNISKNPIKIMKYERIDFLGENDYFGNFTISNLEYPINTISNLYNDQQYMNIANTNNSLPKKMNSIYMTNNSYIENSNQKRNNNNYYNELRGNINLYNTNNKLVKKRIIESSKKGKGINNNILIDVRDNIYDIGTKPSNKYSSNYNLKNNFNTLNENKFNKTSLGGLYNYKKVNYDSIQNNNSRYKLNNINMNLGENILKNNNKRNNTNRLNIKINERNRESKKIMPKENNRIKILDNMYRNNTININKNNYNSTSNNNQNQNKYIQISISNSHNYKKQTKPMLKNQDNIELDKILSRINKHTKRNKNSENFNKINVNKNIRDKYKPISFISPDINSEILSEHILTNENFHHNKTNNISDSLIGNQVENKNVRSRKTINVDNNRRTINFEKNYNYIVNNNNYFNNNKNIKINVFDWKKE